MATEKSPPSTPTGSVSSSISSPRNPCAICLEEMLPSSGLFTAPECPHFFHDHCIALNVEYGNTTCPLCKAVWGQLPFETEPPPPPTDWSDLMFQFDDIELSDTLDPPAPDLEILRRPEAATRMEVGSYTKFRTLARRESREMDILVHLEASVFPANHRLPRAPLDLVLVLDVSSNMTSENINLLKRAATFIVSNLTFSDRLSIITFSNYARVEFTLKRKTAAASDAVDTLSVRSADRTDIARGLILAAKQLEARGPSIRASSILLLSYGRDNRSFLFYGPHNVHLLPPSITGGGGGGGDCRIPVHTFGFGSDHNAPLMSAIARVSGGTFSFVEAMDDIHEAFGTCLGGLLSIVFQNIRVEIGCADPRVYIMGEIKSGAYASRVDDGGRTGSVEVMDMYAFESRDFIVRVLVPTASDDADATELLYLKTTHTESVSQDIVESDRTVMKLARSVELGDDDATLSAEVKQQTNRYEAWEAMAAAKAAANANRHAEAANMLKTFLRFVEGGIDMVSESEVQYMVQLLEDSPSYQNYGRAFILSRINSHSQQRATSQPRTPSTAASFVEFCATAGVPIGASPYQTPVMKKMIRRAEEGESSTSSGSSGTP